MKIYLDNCCYNRPYDDQQQLRVYLETQAKLHIQQCIIQKKIKLVCSFISRYENSENPNPIVVFITNNVLIYAAKGQRHIKFVPNKVYISCES